MPSGDTPDLNLLFPQRRAAAEQKLFGRYTLKRVLGRGGMGIVWMAHDDELHRHVAMKFLPDMLIRDREAVNDLKRETRRSLDLTHHHIVRIYDFTQDDVCAAIIMEYVDGETLSAMKTQQPGGCFSVTTIAAWVAHFCQALDYAHRQARVVHRDLKPANLMVNSRGDLKVTDFGISRSMSDSMTRVSMSNTAGTLAYMSPEQALGAPPAAYDDVYAFGATIYDLLTGRPPFFRGNIQVQLETVIPPKMAERREELGNQGESIPDLWEQVIASCLAKRPQNRPQTMGEIAVLLGLSAPTSPLRTSFSPGIATGTGAGTPGTGSTRARTSATDDAATRTDAVPAAPQTTRPGATGTRGTAYVSTPRPTALRDVIPGYADEAAEPLAETPATAQPPATTPTLGKVEPPSAPEEPIVAESQPPLASEPIVAEIPAPVEEPVEAAVAPVADEVSEVASLPVTPVAEPPVEIPPPVTPEEVFADVVDVEIPGAIEEKPAPAADEIAAVESIAPVETETPPFEPEPAVSHREIAAKEKDQADFPTVFGEPLVFPTPAAPEIEAAQTIELPPTKEEEAAEAVPEIESKEESELELEPESQLEAKAEAEPAPEPEVVEEPEEEVEATIVDEAAATLVDAPLPKPPAPVEPVAPILPSVPPRETLVRRPEPQISRGFPVQKAAPSPARNRSIPWIPIAGVAGVATIVGIWMAIPKDAGKRVEPTTPITTPRPPEPTPDPKIAEIATKLKRSRELFSSQEFPEATALLKDVQQLDPANSEVANLLQQIEKIESEKMAMAKLQQDIAGAFAKADAALAREDWARMRAALEEVLQLDPQNEIAASRLKDLKEAQNEWDRVEKEQRERQLAEQQKEREREQQRKAAEMQAAEEQREQERARRAAEEDTPKKKARAATPRPQRARQEEDTSDRPPRRTPVNREDQRPPAPSRPQVQPRSTPAPAPAPQRKRDDPFRGGPPGG